MTSVWIDLLKLGVKSRKAGTNGSFLYQKVTSCFRVARLALVAEWRCLDLYPEIAAE